VEGRQGSRYGRSVSLTGRYSALTRNSAKGEDYDGSQNTKYNNDDEKFDQGKTVDLPRIPPALKPLVGRNHIYSLYIPFTGAPTVGKP
jgi:hypothetical protein